MNEDNQFFIAKNIVSEEQLSNLLENCGISSQAPKDIDWLFPWWSKEFGPNLPLARYVELLAGDEKVLSSLCASIVKDRFVVYMFNERDYWFDKLGEIEGFTSANELKDYLKKLIDQKLIEWKKWMKTYRP